MTQATCLGSIPRGSGVRGTTRRIGLACVVALFVGCTSPAASSPSGAPAGSPSSPATTPVASAASSGGSLTFGSSYTNNDADKKAIKAVVDAFTAQTGTAVKVNTVDHNTFSDQISSYLQGTPDDAFSWFAGYRMQYFAAQGLATDISDVWAKIGSNYSAAFKQASTGLDGKQYFVPFFNYPWTVLYRKSVFAEHGYAVPKTIDEFKALAAKMKSDGLTPLAFSDKDGWPAMGTFDILDMRLNGYKYHVDLMAGKEKWTDPRTAAVFKAWKDLLPFYGNIGAALGRTWQDAANLLIQKKAGMFFLGTFASGQATTKEDQDDLDFFTFPTYGTQFDAEGGIDAPIDGFMLSAKSPTLQNDLAAAKAFMAFLGTGKAQNTFLAGNPTTIATASDADTSGYSALQKKAAKTIAASGAIAQFMDRDTRPEFASVNGMQAFLQSWLSKPDQDLNAYLQSIQAYWDGLPPL